MKEHIRETVETTVTRDVFVAVIRSTYCGLEEMGRVYVKISSVSGFCFEKLVGLSPTRSETQAAHDRWVATAYWAEYPRVIQRFEKAYAALLNNKTEED